MAQRSAAEIRSSIEANREELAVSIVKLRGEVTHLAPEGRCPEQLGDLGGIRRPRFRRSPGQADAEEQAARADSVEDASAEVIQGVVGTAHDFPAASIGVRRFWPVRTAAARLRGTFDSPDSGCSAVGQSSRVST